MSQSPPPPPQQSLYKTFGDWVWTRAQQNGRLFQHQFEAIRDTKIHLEQRSAAGKSRKAVVVLPTGTGKTGLALTLPYALKSTRVLVVTPRTTLRNQMYEAATNSHRRAEPAFLQRIGVVPLDRPDMIAGVREAVDATQLFDNGASNSMVIANAQMFTDREDATRTEWRQLLPPSTYDLVIIDEAHFHPAKTWKDICDHFQQNQNGCNVVFLTATPFRLDNQLVCEPDEFSFQLHRSVAVNRFIIRNIEAVIVPSSATEQTPQEVNTRNPPTDSLSKRISLMHAIRDTLQQHDAKFPLPEGRRHKALVMVGKDHDRHPSAVADELEKECRKDPLLQDLHARGYYSGSNLAGKQMTSKGLEKIFASFKRAGTSTPLQSSPEKDTDPRVLIVNDMLREGFDFASVSVIGISRIINIDSPTFEQFLGRAVRKYGGQEPDGLSAKFVSHESDGLSPLFARYLEDRTYF